MRVCDLSPEMQMRIFGKVQTPKAKEKLPSMRKCSEDTFAFQAKAFKLPEFKRQYKFAAAMGRGWMFDFCNEAWKIAIEVEGLVVRRVYGELIVGGRHVTPTGFRNDRIKYAWAAILGWTVLSFEQSQVENGTAVDLTMELLKTRGWKSP